MQNMRLTYLFVRSFYSALYGVLDELLPLLGSGVVPVDDALAALRSARMHAKGVKKVQESIRDHNRRIYRKVLPPCIKVQI